MIVHPKMKHVYVGVDTHKWTHTAVVINCFAEKLGEVTIQNRPAEFEGFLKDIKVYAKRGVTPVFGLEDTASSGRELASFLLAKKTIVKQVASSLTWSERKNQAITHKTDSYDALCVARILLNKFDELPGADPRDIYWTLLRFGHAGIAIADHILFHISGQKGEDAFLGSAAPGDVVLVQRFRLAVGRDAVKVQVE
jgi:hypothetical protein